MKDLFGREVTEAEARQLLRRKGTRPKGYYYQPGTGPAGETCKTCKHITRHGSSRRTYLKCGLNRSRWTRGPGSDILAGAPACKYWEAPPP